MTNEIAAIIVNLPMLTWKSYEHPNLTFEHVRYGEKQGTCLELKLNEIPRGIPVGIMTPRETSGAIEKYLKTNGYFGRYPRSVTIYEEGVNYTLHPHTGDFLDLAGGRKFFVLVPAF